MAFIVSQNLHFFLELLEADALCCLLYLDPEAAPAMIMLLPLLLFSLLL